MENNYLSWLVKVLENVSKKSRNFNVNTDEGPCMSSVCIDLRQAFASCTENGAGQITQSICMRFTPQNSEYTS